MARVFRALKARVAPGAEEEGMTTAEYCIGTVAAVAFAMALYTVLKGNFVEGLIKTVLSHALSLVGF